VGAAPDRALGQLPDGRPSPYAEAVERPPRLPVGATASSIGSCTGPSSGSESNRAVAGTGRADALSLAGRVVVGGTATLTGLRWTVDVSHTEGTLDTLAIDTGPGDDTLETSAFAPATIGREVD